MQASKVQEKAVSTQITTVLVPTFSLPKEPIAMGEKPKSMGEQKDDVIDIINMAALQLEIQERWKAMDARIESMKQKASSKPSTDNPTVSSTDIPFEPSTDIPHKPSTDESLKHKSKSSLISLTPDLYKPGIPEEGQASYLKEIIPEVIEDRKSVV